MPVEDAKVPFPMLIYVWDRWPQFFRGRLRVIYELTGEVQYVPRPPVGWAWAEEAG